MSSPSQGEANGATRNTYNKAGYLVKVEGYNGTAWQTQSEMRYDGLGNRLEMTAYNEEGVGEMIRYQLDNGQPLAAVGAESTSFYLYGRGVIGTKTDNWGYILQDGLGSTRQLATHEGVIAMSVAYTPWGDVLEYYGSGGIDFGYLGGMYDEDTGLIYIGGGQYYDPVTGRMLTRGAGQSNPYKPGAFDPAGMMVAPLAMLGLALDKKKKRGKWDLLILSMTLVGITGFSLFAVLPVHAQISIGNNTNGLTAPALPGSYINTTYAGTYKGDFAGNPGSGVGSFEKDVICYYVGTKTSESRVIIFGGSFVEDPKIPNTGINFPGPSVKDKMHLFAWMVDGDGNVIPENQLIQYQGGDNGKANTAIQARGLLEDKDVIIIGYSAGTEAALMYACYRIGMEQPIDSVVLLGPTFEASDESGNYLEFGEAGGEDEFGNWAPIFDFGDWASYIDFILSEANVLVIDDGGSYILDRNDARKYDPLNNATGVFDYWLKWIPHNDLGGRIIWGTNQSNHLRKKVYDWISAPTGK